MQVGRTKLKKVEAKEKNIAKMGDVTAAEFNEAFGALMAQQLPVKTSVALLKIKDAVVSVQKTYETVRSNLIIKHGDVGADGKVKVNEDKSQYVLKDPAGFNKEYVELLELSVELPRIPLSYLDNSTLSPAYCSILMKTILDPEL